MRPPRRGAARRLVAGLALVLAAALAQAAERAPSIGGPAARSAPPRYRISGTVVGLFPDARTTLRLTVRNPNPYAIKVRKIRTKVRRRRPVMPVGKHPGGSVQRRQAHPPEEPAPGASEGADAPHRPRRVRRTPVPADLPRDGYARMKARAAVAIALGLAFVGGPGVAWAAWSRVEAGSAFAGAVTAPTGDTPTVSVTGRNVTVSWNEVSFSDSTPVNGALVERYDGAGVAQGVVASCDGTVTALSCIEGAVPPGT